jgi:hypothetical protein
LDAPSGPGGEAARRPSVVPFEVPVDIPDLTGREKAVASLMDVLDSDGHPDRRTVVAAIAGPAGSARPRWRSGWRIACGHGSRTGSCT